MGAATMIRVLGTLLLACPALASANLMTFDALPNVGALSKTYAEDGITATGNNLVAYWQTPGSAYLAGAEPMFSTRIDFTTGSLFTADSVGILAGGSAFCLLSNCGSGFNDPFPYISIAGYRNNVLLGSLAIYRELADDVELISLLSLGVIDRLTVGVNGGMFGLPGIEGLCSLDTGCGHFSIDSLRVTPAPEPETYGLLIIGALGAWLSRRRTTARSIR